MSVHQLAHHFGLHGNIKQLLRRLTWTDIHGPQRMKPNDVGYLLTFCLAPPWGWQLWQQLCLNNYWMPHILLYIIMFPSGWTAIILGVPRLQNKSDISISFNCTLCWERTAVYSLKELLVTLWTLSFIMLYCFVVLFPAVLFGWE